jgi:phytoene dehydrogenase-like protein
MNKNQQKYKNQQKSVIIIGAGISGLATGCYLQMNGYETKIVEMHNMPGGCCTAWDIKNYRCDYTLGWMPGCGDLTHDLTKIWRELGALQNKQIIHFDIYNTVVSDDGTRINFYVDPDRLKQHLLEISPADKKPIEEFCSELRRFRKFVSSYSIMVLKPQGLLTFFEKIKQFFKLLPLLRLFIKTMTTPMTEFAKKFQSPAIRQSLNCIFYLGHHNDFPVLAYLFNMSFTSLRLGGCPEGGSLGLSMSIAQRYTDLGGEFVYKQKIEKILVRDNQAVGVRNSEGVEYEADYIVSTMDMYNTLKHLLEDRYTTPRLKTLYDAAINKPEGLIFEGVLAVFLGVDVDLSNETHSTTYFWTEEEMLALPGIGVVDRSFSIHIRSNMFPGIAPPGKSLILMTSLCDDSPWEKLDSSDENKRPPKKHTARKRTKAYKEAKKSAAEIFINRFKQAYPHAGDKIEFVNVSTPLTMIRYTGAMRGTILGWVPFAQDAEPFMDEVKKHGPVLPGLKNFYMAGQWMEGCGVLVAASSGRHAAQYICHNDGKKFVAFEP